MDRAQVKARVETYIRRAQNGGTAEDPNFDFKREWMNLTEEKGLYEFLKDTAALVNTLGDDGIIVFGFDDNTKEFKRAVFSDCGLRDETDLNNKISSMVDRPFPVYLYDEEIDGNPVSIIHIPYSADKPHVVKKYKKIKEQSPKSPELENVIFVRRGTASRIANKFELDQMFFDRMHLLPDYRVFVSRLTIKFCSENPEGVKCEIRLSIENAGARVIGIKALKVDFSIPGIPDTQWNARYVHTHDLATPGRQPIATARIRIMPNTIADGLYLLFLAPDSKLPIDNSFPLKELIKTLNSADESSININYQIKLTSGETLRGTVG
ncbi:MAG: ATP-binding protein [Bacteroidia bacterium]